MEETSQIIDINTNKGKQNYNNMQKNNDLMLGFSNLHELFAALAGTKNWIINLCLAIIGVTTTFITNYVYDDAKAVYLLIFMVLADATTGIIRSVKAKRFSSAKLPRILVIILIYTICLSVSWHISKINALFDWLPGVMYGGFIGTLLVSIIENSYEIGILPEHLYLYLNKKIKLVQEFIFGKDFFNKKKPAPGKTKSKPNTKNKLD